MKKAKALRRQLARVRKDTQAWRRWAGLRDQQMLEIAAVAEAGLKNGTEHGLRTCLRNVQAIAKPEVCDAG